MSTYIEGKRHWRRSAAWAVALPLLLLGCYGEPPPAPSWKVINEVIGFDTTCASSSAKRSKSKGLPTLNIYIDGSESMKGFVSHTGSMYARVCKKFQDKATTAKYDIRGHLFSEKIERLDNFSIGQLTSPHLYHGTETDLPELFEWIAMDTNQNCITVVISDLVQSLEGRDPLAQVRAFQAVVARWPSILLIAIRSSFHGDYWIETYPKGKIRLNLNMESEEDGRPFYLLVMAPSDAVLSEFKNFVLEWLGHFDQFEPSLPPLKIQSAKFTLPRDRAEQVWKRRGDLIFGSCPLGPSKLFGKFEVMESAHKAGSPLSLDMTAYVRTPLKSPDKLKYTVERYVFRRGIEKPRRSEISNFEPIEEGKPDGTTIRLNYPFTPPDCQTWEAYRILIQAGDGNLAVPSWVHKWSTDDDRIKSNCNRTLNLDLLIEAMIRATTEKIVFLDQVILLGRR